MTLLTADYARLLSANALMAARLKVGLQGLWPLDEASGTRRDHSGQGNDLTDNNTVTGNPGPSIYMPLASQFTAVNNEFLSAADTAVLRIGVGVRMSIVAWVYADTLGVANNKDIGGKWRAVNSNEYILFYNATTTRYEFGVSSDGLNYTSVSANTFGVPSTGTWHHIYAEYNGTTIGIAVNNGALDTTAFSADIFSGTSPFRIGSSNIAAAVWDGRIAMTGFWKRLLTASERAWLYNLGSGRSLSQMGLPA